MVVGSEAVSVRQAEVWSAGRVLVHAYGPTEAAVIMATGGPGLIFGKSTNSMTCTGSAVSACYQQGAR